MLKERDEPDDGEINRLRTNEGLCLSRSTSDRPAAALGAFQALPREGPGLLPERWRMLRHRDAQRASQALQVSDFPVSPRCAVALLSPAGHFGQVMSVLNAFKRNPLVFSFKETDWVSSRLN